MAYFETMSRYESEYSVYSLGESAVSSAYTGYDNETDDDDAYSAISVPLSDFGPASSVMSITPVPLLEEGVKSRRTKVKRTESQQPLQIKHEDDPKPSSNWPYQFVGIAFCATMFGIILYPLPLYRTTMRFDLYRLFGSQLVDGDWEGGHREMATLTFLLLSLGFTTLFAGIVFTYANVAPPVPTGNGLRLSRWLKRKPVPGVLNVSYGEVYFLMAVVFVNVYWFAVYSSRFLKKLEDQGLTEYYPKLEKVGEALGLNVVITMVFLGLPATRNCFWMVSLGIDYAHGVKYHRWLGYITFMLLLAHCLPYYYSWYKQGTLSANALPCFTCDVAVEGRDPIQNVFGEVALLAFIIIMITSLNIVRRKFYEVFYYSHHLFLVVLAGAVMHYANFVLWLYPTLCLYMIHRILARTQSQFPCEVVEFKPLPGNTTRCVFRRSYKQGGQYDAGQFVYLRVPEISSWQWHAFSISSYPEESSNTFSVHIKDLGEWTRALYGKAIQAEKQNVMPLIYVDGFYGKMTNEFERYPILVLIGGGIGGTPITSILGHMLHVIMEGNYNSACQEVHLHWTSRELSIFKEFEPLLSKIQEYDPEEEIFKLNLHFTGKTIGDDNIVFPSGVSTAPIPNTSQVLKFPFHQSSRTPGRKIAIFVVAFLSSAVLLIYFRYDYKILGKNRLNQHLWPLQRFGELLAVLLGCSVSYILAIAENRPQSRTTTNVRRPELRLSKTRRSETELSIDYKIDRMNVSNILSAVSKKAHGNKGIGVWVSGPQGLIHNVEIQGASYNGIFDVHYEEFEL